MKNWLSQNAALEELSKQQPTQAPKPAEVLSKPKDMTAEERVIRALGASELNKEQGVDDLAKELKVQRAEGSAEALGLNTYMQAKAEGKTPSPEALKMALEEASVIAVRNGTDPNVVKALSSKGDVERLLEYAAGYGSYYSPNADYRREARHDLVRKRKAYTDEAPGLTTTIKELFTPGVSIGDIAAAEESINPKLLNLKHDMLQAQQRYDTIVNTTRENVLAPYGIKPMQQTQPVHIQPNGDIVVQKDVLVPTR
jgi:hypothetical protein